MIAIIYLAECETLNRRLDTIDLTHAWLETKGRGCTQSARELAREKGQTSSAGCCTSKI